MNYKATRLKWARKLLRAKYFVILTDKESVIAISGVDPSQFTDAMALAAQTAELVMFRDKLEELIVQHNKALLNLPPDSEEKNHKDTNEPISTSHRSITTRKKSNSTRTGGSSTRKVRTNVRRHAPKAGK